MITKIVEFTIGFFLFSTMAQFVIANSSVECGTSTVGVIGGLLVFVVAEWIM